MVSIKSTIHLLCGEKTLNLVRLIETVHLTFQTTNNTERV